VVLLLNLSVRSVNAQTVQGIEPDEILNSSKRPMYNIRGGLVKDDRSHQIVGDFYGDGIKGDRPGVSVIRDKKKNTIGYLVNTKRIEGKRWVEEQEFTVQAVNHDEIGYIASSSRNVFTIEDTDHLIVGYIKFNTVTDKSDKIIGYIGNEVMNAPPRAAVLLFFYKLFTQQ